MIHLTEDTFAALAAYGVPQPRIDQMRETRDALNLQP